MIAVAGATGALGSLVCDLLRARGVEVRPIARPEYDLTQPATLRSAEKMEVPLCFFGTIIWKPAS